MSLTMIHTVEGYSFCGEGMCLYVAKMHKTYTFVGGVCSAVVEFACDLMFDKRFYEERFYEEQHIKSLYENILV